MNSHTTGPDWANILTLCSHLCRRFGAPVHLAQQVARVVYAAELRRLDRAAERLVNGRAR